MKYASPSMNVVTTDTSYQWFQLSIYGKYEFTENYKNRFNIIYKTKFIKI